MKGTKITVTKPFIPPLEEFTPYLESIWENKWLTNNGKFHQELEKSLCEYLGVDYISLFTNGTIALITALQALNVSGEVITTPFSFVATTHALWWNNIKPIFCDIDPINLNIDPERIEEAITPNTSAILPVHVYGTPCKVEKIQKIADTFGLKVIYDACHTFGEKIKDQSILNFGDLSVLSFHATKVFTTFEGGAVVSHNEVTKQRIDYLKNFGIADEIKVVAPGINGKMNEVQAAFGLLQLKYVDRNIQKMSEQSKLYNDLLKNVAGITTLKHELDVKYNYSYYPILIDEFVYGMNRDAVYEKFKEYDIYTRRYFYPLISRFPIYRGLSSARPENLPIAENAARKVLCLPIYPDLPLDMVRFISETLINKFSNV